jgi:hypothetical protein
MTSLLAIARAAWIAFVMVGTTAFAAFQVWYTHLCWSLAMETGNWWNMVLPAGFLLFAAFPAVSLVAALIRNNRISRAAAMGH